MKRSLALGPVVLIVTAGIAAAEDRWTEVRSPHFHVVGNAGAAAARRTAERLEGFRAAVAQVFPGQPLEDSATTVVVFKDAASFKPLLPLYEGKRVKVGGLFLKGPDHSYMALDVSAGDDALQIVLHEYTHLLTSRLPLQLPAWVGEGIAELYSTAEIRDGKVALGKPLARHVLLLRQRPMLPLETLFDVDHGSPHYNEQDKAGIFYAQSWALVHYLLMQESNRKRPLRAYLDAVAGGATSTEACRKAFGVEPAALRKELSTYVRQWTFTYLTAPVQPLSPAQVVETPLAAHEAPFYLGDILVHQGRLAEGQPFLEKAIALDPGFGRAYRSLGIGYLQAEDHAAATRWLDAAIERDPAEGLARLYRLRAKMIAAGGSLDAAAAATVHDDARRAAAALPSSADASQLLVYVQHVLGRQDDEAVGAVRNAVRLSPQRHELWERLVHLLLARGEAPEAQVVAGRLRARARTAAEKTRANGLLAIVAAALQPPASQELEAAPEPSTAEPPNTPAGPVKRASPVRIPAVSSRTNESVLRAAGVLSRMNCLPDRRLEFIVQARGRTLRLRADSPVSVLLFRGGALVQLDWTCGPLGIPVDASYVPDGSDDSAGTAVRFDLGTR